MTRELNGARFDLMQSELKSVLRYSPDTGDFIWLESTRGHRAGSLAGSVDQKGYRKIFVLRGSFLAHRLAWLYVYGELPAAFVDHIDRNPANNAIANLRLASRAQNSVNRRSRLGYHRTPHGTFQVQMKVGPSLRHFGNFRSEEEARRVSREAHAEIHGEFSPYYVKALP